MVEKELIKADKLIISTPVYFMGVPSQAKALIDRCQSLWAKKYILKNPISSSPFRTALLLMVGGSKLKGMFDGIERTVKAFLDSAGFRLILKLGFSGVDEPGEIKSLGSARDKVREAVNRLIFLEGK